MNVKVLKAVNPKNFKRPSTFMSNKLFRVNNF